MDFSDFSVIKDLIQPNAEGAYTATIEGSKCVIGPGRYPDTWTVTVEGKLVVTETDDIDHAWRQAKAHAEQIAFNICGPRI